ncbi:hypothetical protein [Pseudomonas sp. NBRC 111135]|uniref:hypothetical protein n=1 Tax=Pseudomonas sp. NBRC 111135 TaxID=1661050 RepID=UPI0006D4470C|nr:hypothetical protein [Pseudomonas sp. NBRC 111135]
MSDLGVLFPQPEIVVVDGLEVKLHAVQMRHFALFGATANALIQVLAGGAVESIHRFGETHANALVAAVSSTTSISRWRAKRLPASVLMQVMLLAIRVNGAFFAQAQSAAIQALAGLQSPSAS